MANLHQVLDGCKVCGKRMLTRGSTLIHRTCDACKAEQRRGRNRRAAACRKAERHAVARHAGAALRPVRRADQAAPAAAQPSEPPRPAAMGAQVLQRPLSASGLPRSGAAEAVMTERTCGACFPVLQASVRRGAEQAVRHLVLILQAGQRRLRHLCGPTVHVQGLCLWLARGRTPRRRMVSGPPAG